VSVVGGGVQHASSKRALPQADRRTTHIADTALDAVQVLSSSTETRRTQDVLKLETNQAAMEYTLVQENDNDNTMALPPVLSFLQLICFITLQYDIFSVLHFQCRHK